MLPKKAILASVVLAFDLFLLFSMLLLGIYNASQQTYSGVLGSSELLGLLMTIGILLLVAWGLWRYISKARKILGKVEARQPVAKSSLLC